jgi:putative ABC transport system permease protein
MRKSRSDLMSQKGKLFGSLVLVYLAVFSYVMFSAMLPTFLVSVENSYQQYAFPDLMVVTYSTPTVVVDNIESIEGIEAVASRYHVLGEADFNGVQVAADVYGIDADRPPDVFRLPVWDGEFLDPTDNTSAIVEYLFAVRRGLILGSDFTLTVFGQEVDLTITGFVNSLEHIVPRGNPKQLIPQSGSLAPVWINLPLLQELGFPGYGEKHVINEILVSFSQEYDESTLVHAALEEIAPYPILASITSDQIEGSDSLIARFGSVDQFIGILAGLIFAAAAFVVYISIRRVIESRARQIGMTRALGYSPNEIQKAYLVILAVMAIVTTIIGIPTGLAAGQAFTQWILDSFGLVATNINAPIDIYFWSLLGGPVTVLISAYFPTRRITSYEPVRAIRGQMMEQSSVGETKLEKIGRKVGASGYGFKYIARVMSLNKARIGLMIVGVMLAAGVAAMGNMMITGATVSFEQYMAQNERWDLIVDFKQPINSTQIESMVNDLEGIGFYESYLKLGTTVEVGGEPTLTTLVCYNATGELRGFSIQTGQPAASSFEVLVDSTVSDRLELELQDIVNLTIGGESRYFTVVGIVSSPLTAIYVPIAAAFEMLEEDVSSGIVLTVDDIASLESFEAALENRDEVESVQNQEDVWEGIGTKRDAWPAIIGGFAFIGMSVLLAVLWNIVSISTAERIPELAQLEAIGWSRNSLSKLLFIEVAIVTVIGVVLSVPFGILIMISIEDFMLSFLPTYMLVVDLVGFIWIGVLSILTAFLATLPSVRRLRRINTSEVVRDRLYT